jgi:hypothetical protein
MTGRQHRTKAGRAAAEAGDGFDGGVIGQAAYGFPDRGSEAGQQGAGLGA